MATRSKGNGSRPAERLAAALKPTYDVEKVAEALQDCMDSAAERAVREVLPRLDKQDETLRMFWKHMKGDPNQRLPIDD